jgi:BirA family transcriptional regulator, biotin operon repressor / biotin---[acetyl-CoA-carboxylase] ligase
MIADGAPPPVDPGALREGLVGPGFFWRELEVVGETGSTNADLLARAAAGDDIAGAVLLAEHQTAGRGRSGRKWSGVPRALVTMSVGVSAEGVPADAWGWVPLATGVAVVDAVVATTGVRAGLKWPNDVLAEGGKLAGILAEVAAPQPAIVVGIGLNVTLQPDEIAEPGATSLAMLGADVDRNELVRSLLRELAVRLGGWRDAGGADAALVEDYRARSLTIGSRVRAALPGDREIVGDAVSVDEQGRLRVDTGASTVAVSAGDIVHLRPIGDAPPG